MPLIHYIIGLSPSPDYTSKLMRFDSALVKWAVWILLLFPLYTSLLLLFPYILAHINCIISDFTSRLVCVPCSLLAGYLG